MTFVVTRNNEAYVITIVRVCGKLFSTQGFGTNFVIHGAKGMKETRWNNSRVFSLRIFIDICLVGRKETCNWYPQVKFFLL
jgi:hypothetical protein